MDREFLTKSDSFNKANIMANVLAPHNFDGIKAHNDMLALAYEEQRRIFAYRLAFAGLGGVIFTGYNLARLGQLSPSGRTVAFGGFLFFTFLTYASVKNSRMFYRPKPAVKEEKEQE